MSVYLATYDDTKPDIYIHTALADLSSVTLSDTDKMLVEDAKGSLKHTTLSALKTEISLPAGTADYVLRYDSANGWEQTGLLQINDTNSAIGIGGAAVSTNLLNIESTIDKIQCYIESSATLSANSDKNVLYVSRSETIGAYDNTSSMLVLHRRNASTGEFLECIDNTGTVIANIDKDAGAYFKENVSVNDNSSPEGRLLVSDTGEDYDGALVVKRDDEDGYLAIFANTNYSATVTDGLRISIDASGHSFIDNDTDKYICLNYTGEGNVGIKTNSPQALLHVAGDMRFDGSLYSGASSGVTGVWTYDDGTNGRTVMTVTNGILTSVVVSASTAATMTWV